MLRYNVTATVKSQQGLAFIGIMLIAAVSLAVTIGVLATSKEKQVGPPSLFQNSPTPTPSPAPTLSPEPTSSPQSTLPPVKKKVVNLNEQFTVQGRDVIEISNTGLTLKITVIALPSAGTYDLPNKVEGQAIYGGQTEQFNLIVGGNQPLEIQEQRRQKKVFNTFIIYAKKVVVDETTLIVTK